jgi:hypothetical protein
MAIVLAPLLGSLAALPAAAVTSGTAPLAWNGPGPASCNAACDRGWAFDKMRAVMPHQVFTHLRKHIHTDSQAADYPIATGSVIVAMSYVKDGSPAIDFTRRVAQLPAGIDYAAEGHAVEHDGRIYRFIRIAASGDWALIVDMPGRNVVARSNSASNRRDGMSHWGGTPAAGGGSASGGSALGGEAPLVVGRLPVAQPGLPGEPGSLTGPLPTGAEPPPTSSLPNSPLPIPLPGTLGLLAAGAAALGWPKLLRRDRRPRRAG